MNRRDFFKGLLAGVAAAVVPVAIAKRYQWHAVLDRRIPGAYWMDAVEEGEVGRVAFGARYDPDETLNCRCVIVEDDR